MKVRLPRKRNYFLLVEIEESDDSESTIETKTYILLAPEYSSTQLLSQDITRKS